MSFEFRLPDIGEGVVEGEIVKWYVKEGDVLTEDQPMVEVMTDKATVEIPSPRAGTVSKINVAEGKMCAVGAIMLVIDEGKGATPAASTEKETMRMPTSKSFGTPAAQAPTASANGGDKVLAAPATRKLARDLGVDIATVSATGKFGRITREDVESAKNGGGTSSSITAKSSTSISESERRAPISVPMDVADTRVAFKGIRKKIAENMHRSRQTAAHFTYVEECDMSELVALRTRMKGRRAGEEAIKISFLPFIIKAVCAGLKKYPIVNSTLDESTQEIVLKKRYHIGVAAATGEGLVVPVLRDADRRSIFDIAKVLDELSDKARIGKASRDELTGSTFTISSLGSLGGILATPIINHPEVAILGVHKIRSTPVVREGQIVVREMMNLSISLDHRIVDGFEGAQFLQYVIALLEDPTLMFMDMV